MKNPTDVSKLNTGLMWFIVDTFPTNIANDGPSAPLIRSGQTLLSKLLRFCVAMCDRTGWVE